MRWSPAVGAVLVVTAVACRASGTGHGISLSPSVLVGSPAASVPPESPSPTPGPDGPLEVGGATVSLTGDLTAQVSFPTLVEPDTWAPPPAPMDLTWDEPTGQSLSLSGTSFASRAPTSDERVLSFVVTGPAGPVEFSSSTGECSITITPALPADMGGVFSCTSLTDVGGTTTVSANGTFSATG